MRMVPLTHRIVLANVARYLVEGVFDPGEPAEIACTMLLDDLARTTLAVAHPRSQVAA